MDQLPSPRVNSARLPDYLNKTVRLACKVLRFGADSATVLACDGGEVTVLLPPRDTPVMDTYVEIIGTVTDKDQIKMLTCINMGQELDLKLVNDTVELIHNPKFSRIFHPTS